jgi:hypothetical protein
MTRFCPWFYLPECPEMDTVDADWTDYTDLKEISLGCSDPPIRVVHGYSPEGAWLPASRAALRTFTIESRTRPTMKKITSDRIALR